MQKEYKHLQFEPKGSPWVAKWETCGHRVPHLVSGLNYQTGWGETCCKRCMDDGKRGHYGWSVMWARTHQNRPRSAMGKARNER